MVQKNMPVELLCLIFEFAYGYKFFCDPLRDVDVQKNIQESIPPCFFNSTLPPVGWFTITSGDWNRTCCQQCVQVLECVLVPSPFKRGNPYYPTHGLDTSFPKWAPSVLAFVRLLSSTACQRNHTYKKCIVRNATKMIRGSVLQWNVYYERLFSKDFLLDKKNYFLEANPWANQFISKVCDQLRRAQFLPFYSLAFV